MRKKHDCETLFITPFHKDYWRLAALELTDVRMLIIAAFVIAVRVALNPYAITIFPNLEIKLSFWINAAGAMIYGPVVGALTGAVSDTLSCILFPSSGPYFFPFIFVEMLGSFVFALFLYRAKLSALRVILSRVAVVVSCNFILNPLIMIPYYQIAYENKAYTLYSLMLTVLKNVLLFPIEALVLVVFISAVIPGLKQLRLVSKSQPKLYLEKKHYVIIAALFLIAVLVIILIWHFDVYTLAKNFLKNRLK